MDRKVVLIMFWKSRLNFHSDIYTPPPKPLCIVQYKLQQHPINNWTLLDWKITGQHACTLWFFKRQCIWGIIDFPWKHWCSVAKTWNIDIDIFLMFNLLLQFARDKNSQSLSFLVSLFKINDKTSRKYAL